MKIVLSGVETNNKGAELMFYAILQEIERRFPDATVYVGLDSVRQGLSYLKTSLNIKRKPIEKIIKILDKIKIRKILKKIHLTPIWLTDIYTVNGCDYFIDASGLRFSDQMAASKKQESERWRLLLMNNKKQHSKIIFLPQTFGPFERLYTKQTLLSISKYADMVFSREETSTLYLKQSGLMDMDKVLQYPDFTSLVEGYVPEKYTNLKSAICIIPNRQMITQGVISKSSYLNFLVVLIEDLKASGYTVYLLNHQGKADEDIAIECMNLLHDKIEFLNGLNALEVKGVISQSRLVITSRFHGAVSSLNSCVPCLATSWSHKYEELFYAYKQSDCILDVNNVSDALIKVHNYLDNDKNKQIRRILESSAENIKNINREMWEIIWKGNIHG